MGTAQRYSRLYVTFVRVAVAQDQRHLLTTAKTVMKLTKTRKKTASTKTKTLQEQIKLKQRHAPTSKTLRTSYSSIIIFINSQ